MGYKDDLKTAHWQKRRLEILEKANWACEDCGAKGDAQLHVHHTAYLKGKKPWEHSSELLMALCDHCHGERQWYEDSMRESLGIIFRRSTKKELFDYFWVLTHLQDDVETQKSVISQCMNVTKKMYGIE